jgi:hypothetical protein
MDVAQFISSVGALLHPHRNGQAAAGAADADSDAVPADDGAAVPDDDGAAPPHALAAEPRRKGRGRKRAEPPVRGALAFLLRVHCRAWALC